MWNKEQFFKKLYPLLDEKHWSLNELTNQAELSSGMIYKWEKYDVEPSLSSLAKISKALEVPLEYFFGEEINDNRKQKISLLTMLSNKLSDNQLDVVIAMVRGLTKE